MELNSQPQEIDQASWDEVTADDASSPGESFSDAPPGADDSDAHQAEDGQPAASSAPAEPAAATPAPAESADPFAGLPEAVRNALATIPTLQQELRSTVGRVGALQRELAQARQPAPEPEAPRQPSKLEALRQELPEVADALEEATRNRGPSPEELRAELAAQMQEELLESQRPTWAQDLTGNDFQQWLTTQTPQYQQQVRESSRASVVLGALSKYDAFKSQAVQRIQQLQRNQSRLSAAVTPSSGTRRAPAKSEDDMTDDELWNEITR